ncbi:hypothetical protein SAMN02745215_03247 [Desulfitobacterium chlororespirans DSM 11544]|uniref:Uncharacterized protein n=1 Tax=Desulfitobacterium chlororespirans DSM 11544 TaxID=1121395 RepID=A0A1M7U9L9_9FIRM|nr:hypothetical protein SAMN02745215_03247 [Desulfitobacterium chlororespirans DSM 11544]
MQSVALHQVKAVPICKNAIGERTAFDIGNGPGLSLARFLLSMELSAFFIVPKWTSGFKLKRYNLREFKIIYYQV